MHDPAPAANIQSGSTHFSGNFGVARPTHRCKLPGRSDGSA
jgi:hypothetical protein